MYRISPRKIVVPATAAAAFTLLLAVIPFVHAARAEFLGKDVSGLASSIVGIYPGYFIKELVTVLGVSFFCLLLVSCVFWFVRRSLHLSGWTGRAIFPGGLLLFYSLFYLQSLYKYPALYETMSPLWLERFVFWSAGLLSPGFFQWSAVLLLSVPLVFTGWRVPEVRRPLLAVAAILALVLGATIIAKVPQRSLATTSQHGDPNILLISVDSIRSDHVAKAMPTLHALRTDKESADFRNHYVGVPRTFPSWIELLYGNYAPSTSVRHMFPGFGHRRQKTRPFPELLKERGYRTTVISDFAGDIFPRFEGGFDNVLAPSMNLRGLIQLAVHQKFTPFLPFATSDTFAGFFPALVQNPAFADPQRLADQFAAAGRSDTPEMPWFTTIFFSTAHFPYAAPWPHYSSYTERSYEGPFFFQKNPEITGDEVLTDDNIAQTRGLYQGALTAIDQSLASIFRQLRASGEWDRTIIVVTGDHGEDLYENGRLQGHGEHLAGKNVIKVPLVIRIPGADFSGRSPFSAVTRSIDVGPTLLGAVGLSLDGIQGENLFPWISGQFTSAPDLVAFSETGIWFSASGKGEFQSNRLAYPGISGLLSFDHGMSQEIILNPAFEKIVATSKHRSIVSGNRKLIYSPTEEGVRFAMYDEESDPDNLIDLSSAEPEKLQEMKSLFFTTMARIDPRSKRVGDYFVGP